MIFTLPDGRTAAVLVQKIHNGHHIRLGCEFPPDVIIDREEIHNMREIVQPAKPLLDQVVEMRATLSTIKRLLAAIDPYIDSPYARDHMAKAYALFGIAEGRKSQAEDALDLAENERGE